MLKTTETLHAYVPMRIINEFNNTNIVPNDFKIKKSVKREKAIIFQGNDLLSNSLIFFSYVKNDRLFILKIGQVKDNTDKIDP